MGSSVACQRQQKPKFKLCIEYMGIFSLILKPVKGWAKKLNINSSVVEYFLCYQGRLKYYIVDNKNHAFIILKKANDANDDKAVKCHLIVNQEINQWQTAVELDEWKPNQNDVKISQHSWNIVKAIHACYTISNTFGQYKLAKNNCHQYNNLIIRMMQQQGPSDFQGINDGTKIRTMSDFYNQLHSIQNYVYIYDAVKKQLNQKFQKKHIKLQKKRLSVSSLNQQFESLVEKTDLICPHTWYKNSSEVVQQLLNILTTFFKTCDNCQFILAPLLKQCYYCECTEDYRRKMVYKLENIVIEAINKRKPMHPFFVHYIDKRIHNVYANGPSIWQQYKFKNIGELQTLMFSIIEQKEPTLSREDRKFVDFCIAGHIFFYDPVVSSFRNFKEYQLFFNNQDSFYDYDNDEQKYYEILSFKKGNDLHYTKKRYFTLIEHDETSFKGTQQQSEIAKMLFEAVQKQKRRLVDPLEQFYRNKIKDTKLGKQRNYNINSQYQDKDVTQFKNCKLVLEQLPNDSESKTIFKEARLRSEQSLSKQSLIFHAIGRRLKPEFDKYCRKIQDEYSKECKMNPDKCFRIVDGFVKTASRIEIKSKSGYKRIGAEYILDIIRTTFIVGTAQEAVALYKFITRKALNDVVFVSNDFNKKDEYCDYRKLTINIIIRHPTISCLEMISEIQITTIQWASAQEHLHFFYNLSRINDANAIAKDCAKVYQVEL